jgi:predicted phage baseplate assembly protein
VLAAPASVRFEVPLTAGLLGELTARTFGPLLQAVFAANGLASMPTATASVRGADPLWSVSDGTTFVQLRARAGNLQALTAPEAASAVTRADPRAARPSAALTATIAGQPTVWTPEPDLLASRGDTFAFVCETDTDATVRLRFGDDEHGRRPPSGTRFTTHYRVGTGQAGNVGAEAIGHVVTGKPVIGVRNPVPAAGGIEPETEDEIRRDAPYAFLVQERAVTPDDWAEVTERDDQVQRAAATYRWTGSWHTVFLTADRRGGKPVDAAFATGLRPRLERYRLAGYDLEVNAPVFVPLEIALTVCVTPGRFRSDVGEAVRVVLGTQVLPDGSLGLFHPDRLTFGSPVYLSSVYAAVHAVPGVDSVDVTVFQRLRVPDSSGLESGVLPMGRLEIARLDNDPNFPERGTITLTLGGGI